MDFDIYEPLPVMQTGDYDLEGMGVQMAPGRDGHFRAAMVPRRAGRLPAHALVFLSELEKLALRIREQQEELVELVGECRAAGVSWSLIGWATGLTEDGARKSFTFDD